MSNVPMSARERSKLRSESLKNIKPQRHQDPWKRGTNRDGRAFLNSRQSSRAQLDTGLNLRPATTATGSRPKYVEQLSERNLSPRSQTTGRLQRVASSGAVKRPATAPEKEHSSKSLASSIISGRTKDSDYYSGSGGESGDDSGGSPVAASPLSTVERIQRLARAKSTPALPSHTVLHRAARRMTVSGLVNGAAMAPAHIMLTASLNAAFAESGSSSSGLPDWAAEVMEAFAMKFSPLQKLPNEIRRKIGHALSLVSCDSDATAGKPVFAGYASRGSKVDPSILPTDERVLTRETMIFCTVLRGVLQFKSKDGAVLREVLPGRSFCNPFHWAEFCGSNEGATFLADASEGGEALDALLQEARQVTHVGDEPIADVMWSAEDSTGGGQLLIIREGAFAQAMEALYATLDFRLRVFRKSDLFARAGELALQDLRDERRKHESELQTDKLMKLRAALSSLVDDDAEDMEAPPSPIEPLGPVTGGLKGNEMRPESGNKVPVTSVTTANELVNMLGSMEQRTFHRDETLVEEGEVALGLFFVVEGSIKLTRQVHVRDRLEDSKEKSFRMRQEEMEKRNGLQPNGRLGNLNLKDMPEGGWPKGCSYFELCEIMGWTNTEEEETNPNFRFAFDGDEAGIRTARTPNSRSRESSRAGSRRASVDSAISGGSHSVSRPETAPERRQSLSGTHPPRATSRQSARAKGGSPEKKGMEGFDRLAEKKKIPPMPWAFGSHPEIMSTSMERGLTAVDEEADVVAAREEKPNGAVVRNSRPSTAPVMSRTVTADFMTVKAGSHFGGAAMSSPSRKEEETATAVGDSTVLFLSRREVARLWLPSDSASQSLAAGVPQRGKDNTKRIDHDHSKNSYLYSSARQQDETRRAHIFWRATVLCADQRPEKEALIKKTEQKEAWEGYKRSLVMSIVSERQKQAYYSNLR